MPCLERPRTVRLFAQVIPVVAFRGTYCRAYLNLFLNLTEEMAMRFYVPWFVKMVEAAVLREGIIAYSCGWGVCLSPSTP